jgi:hypothetical protein
VLRRRLLLTLAGIAVLLCAVGVFELWPARLPQVTPASQELVSLIQKETAPVKPTGPDRVTRENCDLIWVGMSRSSVVEILGSPGDYRTVRTAVDHSQEGIFGLFPINVDADDFSAEGKWETEGGSPLIRGWWQGNEGQIIVIFSPETVFRTQFIRTTRKPGPAR